jgi:predicted phage terminase large subunit-like protein
MPTDKQALSRWNNYVRLIMASTAIDTADAPEVIEQRVQTLEAQPEEWFKYYFPAFTTAPPASFHINATRRLLQNPEWFEVRMWAREIAKSTRTMLEVLYLTLSRQKKYVLLISNSLDNATRLLQPYKANLEANRRIAQDYGNQPSLGHWTNTEFVTDSGIAFRAIGAGQSPRGTRNEAARPDMIIFDDIDTDEDCLNSEIIAKKWRWIEEAAIGTRSVSAPTAIIFCGNRIAVDCCVQRACKIADHIDEVNIRDAGGRSSWQEKNTEAHINRVLGQKSYAAIQKEYFNNPLSEGAVFKKMHYKPLQSLGAYRQLICYTDPSYKTASDYKATVLVGAYQTEFHIIKCFLEQTTSAAMLDWHYQIMDLAGTQNCYYYMEASFMQDVLVNELANEAAKRGRHIPIRGDTRQKKDKFTRIECLLEPLNRNGQLFLNLAEQHNPHMQRLAEQFTAFSPSSRAHDDGPDAVEGAIWLLNQKANTFKDYEFYGKVLGQNRW